MGTILAIDDDPVVVKVLKVTLELAGHDVRVAGDISEAHEALEDDRYDLILLDLNLPDGSGFDVLRYIRETLNRPTRVIVLSGLKQEHNIVRGLELGADDYVTKPFSPREVAARVDRWLGG